MAYIKMVNKKYNGNTTTEANANIYSIVNYVLTDKNSHTYVRYLGGVNVDPLNAAEQFIKVKNYYRKNNPQSWQVRHFIVSFCKKDYINPLLAYGLGYKIAEFYANRYQIIFGVHEDTNYIHIHFAFNSVSFVDGKLYDRGYDDYYRLKHLCNIAKKFISVM